LEHYRKPETTTMTPKAQRIAIAKFCGYTQDEKGFWYAPGQAHVWFKTLLSTEIPDYLNDLNATVQVCDFLADRGWNCNLGNGLDKTWECEFYKADTEHTHTDNLGTFHGKQVELHYGSADRLGEAISEAFLRTLNLWKDEPVPEGDNAPAVSHGVT
jgi:hypothetical protein